MQQVVEFYSDMAVNRKLIGQSEMRKTADAAVLLFVNSICLLRSRCEMHTCGTECLHIAYICCTDGCVNIENKIVEHLKVELIFEKGIR